MREEHISFDNCSHRSATSGGIILMESDSQATEPASGQTSGSSQPDQISSVYQPFPPDRPTVEGSLLIPSPDNGPSTTFPSLGYTGSDYSGMGDTYSGM